MLLVEGQDDLHVVGHICERHSSDFSFDIISKDGWEKLRGSISVEIKVPGRQIVGILADADDDPAGRWDSIKDQLRKADINAEGPSFPQGLIVAQSPKIGAWLMPDNKRPGELEDFAIEMIPMQTKYGDDPRHISTGFRMTTVCSRKASGRGHSSMRGWQPEKNHA